MHLSRVIRPYRDGQTLRSRRCAATTLSELRCQGWPGLCPKQSRYLWDRFPHSCTAFHLSPLRHWLESDAWFGPTRWFTQGYTYLWVLLLELWLYLRARLWWSLIRITTSLHMIWGGNQEAVSSLPFSLWINKSKDLIIWIQSDLL